MMTATPTPDEAQRALQDIEDRKPQTAAAAASPRWWWIGIGLLVALGGPWWERRALQRNARR